MSKQTQKNIEDKKQSMVAHFIELKKRFIYCFLFFIFAFAISYYYAAPIYNFLVEPLSNSYHGQTGKRLIYTGLTEAFFAYVNLALNVALLVSFPFFAIQIYIFIAPGLYKSERRALLPFLFMSPILFIMGGCLLYYMVMPMAWKFFISFESLMPSHGLPIELEARVSEYLQLVLHLILAFGIAFQLPILLMLLARLGFVSAESLAKKRKIAIVVIFIVAAFLTPPDVISQIGLAIPLLLLYEFSIICCKMSQKGKKHA